MVKNLLASVRDVGLIPGLGRSLGGGHGSPLQYSCLENPMDRGSLRGSSPWGHKELDTTKVIAFMTWHSEPSGERFHGTHGMRSQKLQLLLALGIEDFSKIPLNPCIICILQSTSCLQTQLSTFLSNLGIYKDKYGPEFHGFRTHSNTTL